MGRDGRRRRYRRGEAQPSYRAHAPSIAIRRITSLKLSPPPHGAQPVDNRSVQPDELFALRYDCSATHRNRNPPVAPHRYVP